MRAAGLTPLSVTAALLLGSCSGADVHGPASPEDGATALRVTALVVGTPIDLMVAVVTAGDIPAPLVFNLPVVEGVAAGTLRVPPGGARTISLEAFDETGDVTHHGVATVDVRTGRNPPVSIILVPLGGEVPVTATIGHLSVVVSPAAATVAAGGALQFTAAVLGPDQEPVAGTVAWAVTDPTVARVDAAGLVTGIRGGSLQLVAMFGGVAGLANIMVEEGTVADPGG